ncbi:MAG: flippase-like domain-containing protein [Rhodobacteraceae bacterium]|nr:flippase-like domain-containing protein [Paracoccaceae bacterium]
MGGLLGLFLAGLAGLAAATGWQETLAQIARLGWVQIAALLGLSLVNYILRGLRWHLFARRLGLPTGLVGNLRHFLGGFAMVVTPGRVGELIRMRWIGRETGWSFDRSAPLVLVDRASDLAAMALILGLAIAAAATGIAGGVPVTLLALAAAVIVTRPALLACAIGRTYAALRRFPRAFARARAAARSMERFSHGPVLAGALALGMAGWLAEGWAFHLLLVWMGADIGAARAVAIFVFATLAGGLTGAPGGVGGAEAAMIALLTLDGVPLEAAVAATAVIRLTTLWFALAIGLAVLPLAERASLKGPDAVEVR